MERLQKVIANSGYCSRRKAEEEIKKGHVTVNGRVVMELGTKVDTQDVVEINGTVIKKEENKEKEKEAYEICSDKIKKHKEK